MPTHSTQNPDIRKFGKEQFGSLMESLGQPAFRGRQIYQWLWQKGATSFSEMTNLPLGLREVLDESYGIYPIEEDTVQKSRDGTVKTRYRLRDGYFIEAVLIPVPEDKRFTVCVSSQVGCSLSCSFCATGRMKRERNLEAAEIVDQVRLVNKQCLETFGYPLSNIVFMGMGEPLLAYQPVMKAIHMISSPDGLAMSPRRITLSTAGIAKMIRQMADEKVRFNLALSLHAANDKKRDRIMPINESNNLATLMDALEYFYSETKNRISYEYIALRHFNDSREDALELAALCRRFPVRVNIIEYNPVEGVAFDRSGEDTIDRFAKTLRDRGVMVTVRRSRGKDIDAACGQLANKD